MKHIGTHKNEVIAKTRYNYTILGMKHMANDLYKLRVMCSILAHQGRWLVVPLQSCFKN